MTSSPECSVSGFTRSSQTLSGSPTKSETSFSSKLSAHKRRRCESTVRPPWGWKAAGPNLGTGPAAAKAFVWLRGHICTPNSAFVSEIPPHTFGLSEPQQACRVLNTLMFKNGRFSFTVMVWKRTPQLVKWFSSDSALLCFGAGFRVECSC